MLTTVDAVNQALQSAGLGQANLWPDFHMCLKATALRSPEHRHPALCQGFGSPPFELGIPLQATTLTRAGA